MKSFQNKVAVVTGAGSGIGRALALQLAGEGAIVALCDIDENSLSETAALIRAQGGEESQHLVDVTDRQAMYGCATAVLAQHQQVDLLFNNAGITLTPTPFSQIPHDQFQKVIDINLWGVYHGVRAFLPHLQERPEAAIINISSLAGLLGLWGYSPYVMSKFAVRGLSETLQMELAGTGITVTSVHPGGVKTNIIRHAPDIADSAQRDQAHQAFTKTASLTAEKAARLILRAVSRKKNRLILGVDARLVHFIRWLLPTRFPQVLQPIFSRSTFASAD